MRKNLGGGSKQIEARLKAYDEAIKAGATKEQAMKAAQKAKRNHRGSMRNDDAVFMPKGGPPPEAFLPYAERLTSDFAKFKRK